MNRPPITITNHNHRLDKPLNGWLVKIGRFPHQRRRVFTEENHKEIVAWINSQLKSKGKK
jgi:hypothetical protein